MFQLSDLTIIEKLSLLAFLGLFLDALLNFY